MRRTILFGCITGMITWAGVGSLTPARGAIAVALKATPNPVIVEEGNPGAIKWTFTNNSTATLPGDNTTVVVDLVRMSVGFPMVFLGGDKEDEAYNPELVNPDQYKNISLLAGSGFSFTEVFQTRDLGTTVEPDIGYWQTSVVVEFHAATGPFVQSSTLADGVIHVTDPGVPEPSAAAVAMLTGAGLLRPLRKRAA